jgi:hypothetical protein
MRMMRRFFCLTTLCISASFSSICTAQSNPDNIFTVGSVQHGPIAEMSGIVKSRKRENLYWVHNDSGDEARIFAIDSEGNTIIPTYSKFSFYCEDPEDGKRPWQGFKVLYSKNVDWEDITIDDNYIYIADTGNNGNARQDLGIYMISEIDPTASTQSASIKYLPVRYPEQVSFPASLWHFDSESLFSADGSLYMITKHRAIGKGFEWEAGANLYRLDTDYTDQDNLLTYIDGNRSITAATGAELSPDMQTLAVISLTALWLFDRPESGDEWLSSSSRKIDLDPDVIRQVEAVTWIDDQTVLLSNEQRDLFRVDISDL